MYLDDCVGILFFFTWRRSLILADSLRLNDATVLAAALAAAAVAALVSLEACPKAVDGRVFIKLANLFPAALFPKTDLDADEFLPANAKPVGAARLCFPESFSPILVPALVAGRRISFCWKFLCDGFLRPDGIFLILASRAK